MTLQGISTNAVLSVAGKSDIPSLREKGFCGVHCELYHRHVNPLHMVIISQWMNQCRLLTHSGSWPLLNPSGLGMKLHGYPAKWSAVRPFCILRLTARGEKKFSVKVTFHDSLATRSKPASKSALLPWIYFSIPALLCHSTQKTFSKCSSTFLWLFSVQPGLSHFHLLPVSPIIILKSAHILRSDSLVKGSGRCKHMALQEEAGSFCMHALVEEDMGSL